MRISELSTCDNFTYSYAAYVEAQYILRVPTRQGKHVPAEFQKQRSYPFSTILSTKLRNNFSQHPVVYFKLRLSEKQTDLLYGSGNMVLTAILYINFTGYIPLTDHKI